MSVSITLFSQNVAINTSGTSGYVSAILDLSNQNTAGTVGFLPPYVNLNLPLTTFQLSGTAAQSNGIIIYATGAGTAPAGLYYWNNAGTTWVAMGGGGSTLTACGAAITNDIPIYTNSTTICNSIINENVAGTMIGIGLPVVNTEQQGLSVYNGAVIDQASANAGTISNAGADQNLHFGGGSGEGIGSNRNSSPGYEKFGLQFYTGTQLAMNITNMISGTQPGQVSVINGLNVDQAGTNNGFLNNNLTTGNGLTFGLSSGEGIASKRTAGGNLFGLDFYTNFINRMSVTQGGNVGISNTQPSTLLQVGNAATVSGKLSVYSQDFQFGQIQIGNPNNNAEASMQFISGVTAFGIAAASVNGISNLWNIGAGSYGAGGNKFIISNVTNGPIMTFVSAGAAVGIGTTIPARELEVAQTTSTVRIDGIKAGNTFYSNTTPTTAASSIMFTNNATGDVQALAPAGSNGQVLTQTATGPAWQASAGSGVLNKVTVLLNGTTSFTTLANTTSIIVELVGGGGGGGGAANDGTANQSVAAGGGAAGYCKVWITGLVGATVYTCSIGLGGAGGTSTNTSANTGSNGAATTFNGAAYSANGGSGGTGGTGGNSLFTGGAGGTANGGLLNTSGGMGGPGFSTNNNGDGAIPGIASGAGGASFYGGGGGGVMGPNNGSTGGNPGQAYGSGGSGAISDWNGNPSHAIGGTGSNGVIIVYEYK